MDVDDICAKCRKRPTNPHTMVCGHTFCLSPCVQTMKTYQNFVRCPLCRIETDVACLTPRRSVQSSHPGNPPVCSECNRSSPSSKICEHCSRAICPGCTSLHQAEMLALLAKKLSALQSKRTALTSLKATLLKLKDNQKSCRETLAREVTSATDKLLSMTDCALEKAKLLVISTSNEEQTLSRKLGKDIMHLVEMHRCLSKTACDVQGKKNSAGLKEFELSARTHLDKVKELKKSVKCCEASGISSLTVAKKFETIHLQLQELRLVTSDSVDLPAPQQSKAKKKSSTNPAFMRKTEWDVNPHRIFVGSLPESIKECSLHEYFSEYGIVTDVFLSKGQESRRFGYVTFRDLDSVRKVLDSQPHKMNETPVTVSLAKNKRPADSGVSECEKGETASSASEDKRLNNSAATELVSNQLTVFVGQLKPTVSEADLKAYFSKFGTVTEASVIRNKTTGESRGFGFVTFSDKEAFEGGVLEACHFLDGCRLNVRPANPRSKIRDPSSQGNTKPETSTVGPTGSRTRAASRRRSRGRGKNSKTSTAENPASIAPSAPTRGGKGSESVPYGRQHAISNATPSASNATTSAAWTSLSARDTAPTGSMLKPVTGNTTWSSATLTTPNQVPFQRQFGGGSVPHGRQHPVSNAAPSTSNATTWSARTSLSANDHSPYSRIGEVSSTARLTPTITTPTARTSGFASDYSPYSRISGVSSMTRSTSTTTTPTVRTSGFASHAQLNKRKYGKEDSPDSSCQIL